MGNAWKIKNNKKKFSGQLFQVFCCFLRAAPNASDFKAKFLSSISPSNLKPFCAASATERLWPVLSLLFRHYREAADSPVLSLSHFHGKTARLAMRDTRRGATAHANHKASYLSSKPWAERDTLDTCTAVSTARTFVCLSGTDSSPCQELRAQQVTGQCHLMEERPMQRGKPGRWGAAKATTFCWGRRASGPYVFWIVCFKILKILRTGKISFPE